MIKTTFRLSVLALVGVLLATLCLNAFPQAKVNLVNAITTLPVDGTEYASGTVIPENSPLPIWYNWIDTSGTQVLYYAIYTTPNYSYPVPIANLVGQHFRLTDGTQVFIASALSGLEVYRDLNGDGIPQSDFAMGESEILYFMYTNTSDSFSMTPVEKVMQNSTPHYKWGFTYENVHGFLQNAGTRLGVDVSVVLDRIGLSYDFSVEGNISKLKTNFEIGEVTDLTIHDSSPFGLEGLSLALLYATATYTSKPYSTYVDGQAYNPTTAADSAVEADLAQVQVDNVEAYDFVFGGNYTLHRDDTNETHQATVETYEAKAVAVTLSGIPMTIRINPINGMGFFRNKLDLADLFGGSWQSFELDYETSSLIYRICFPAWDGMQIEHDPVYVGYILSSTNGSHANEFPVTLVFAASTATVVALLALFSILKKRKRSAEA